MRIAVLPLDSRPCNTQFVRRLVTWAGASCALPEAAAMDHFRHPAPYEASKRFLETELPRCGAAVISLEHWCFGSLLASREELISAEEALARLMDLRILLRRCPEVPVYLSSVLLRSSVSTLCKDDLAAYHAMTEYSVCADRYARFSLPEDRTGMERAARLIPPEVLEKALRVRERNLRVNLAAVDLAADGFARSLSVLQEDSQPFGLHRRDQRKVTERIRERGAGNVFLRNGTDEAGALSAAEALRQGRKPLGVRFCWLGEKSFTAPYEDRPFRENLDSACREAGIMEDADSDIVICVCCPEHGEGEEAVRPASGDYLGDCARRVDALLNEGSRVYLLDIVRANGGSPGLLSAMTGADSLSGYSAWNTASNAMGTLLAQVITDALRGAPNRRFFQERLLDDLAYQAVIRERLQERLTALGEDVFALEDKAGAEELLRSLFREMLPGLWPLRKTPEFRVSLPWERTFEIRAEIRAPEEEAE